jgi:hypothetical protein
MPIPFLVHPDDAGNEIHPVLPPVIQTADERGDKDIPFLRPPGRCINRSCLLLGKTEGQVHPEPLFDRSLRRLQTFPRGREFNMGIGNPGKHLPPLTEHLLR